MPSRPPLWKKLLLSAVSLVATVGLLEGGAHAWDYAEYGTWRIDGQPQGLYVRDGDPTPRLQPGARLEGLRYSVHVNQYGLRGPELQAEKPRGGVRIWCVGGSTTFDIYASDDAHTWPAVVERELRTALPGRSIEVLNGGVPGDILEGSATKLARLGHALAVDMVVIYHGANDLRAVTGGHLAVARGPGPSLRSLDALRTWAMGRGLLTGSLPHRAPTPHDRMHLAGRLGHLERHIRQLGATPIYATHALRPAPDATGSTLRLQAGELPSQLQMSAESVRDWYDLWNGLIRERAHAEKATLVDVRGAVGPDAHLWGDATHFTDAGSELAGRAVAAAIAERLRR